MCSVIYIPNSTAATPGKIIPICPPETKANVRGNMLPTTMAELAKHKNICGMKEASGNISQVAEMARLMPDDFYLMSGNDDMVVTLLSVGGVAVISVVANKGVLVL